MVAIVTVRTARAVMLKDAVFANQIFGVEITSNATYARQAITNTHSVKLAIVIPWERRLIIRDVRPVETPYVRPIFLYIFFLYISYVLVLGCPVILKSVSGHLCY